MKRFLLFLIIFLFASNISLAQAANPSSTPSPAPNFTYDLPFPGLLPGTTLYPLKVLRDRIVEFFITDSAKRADFYLLSADKHLNAGIFLFDRNKKDLGESTISKGENYLEKAIMNAGKAKKEQESADDVINRIYLSSRKHQEVIKDLEKKSDGEIAGKLEQDYKRASDIENSARSLIH